MPKCVNSVHYFWLFVVSRTRPSNERDTQWKERRDYFLRHYRDRKFFLHFAAFSLLIFAPSVCMYVCMCADWKCVMIREISVGKVSTIYAYFSFISDDNSIKEAGVGVYRFLVPSCTFDKIISLISSRICVGTFLAHCTALLLLLLFSFSSFYCRMYFLLIM